MDSKGAFLRFRQKVMCRRVSAQRTAMRMMREMRNELTYEERKALLTEWDHYLLGHLDRAGFILVLDEIGRAHGWV